VEAVGIVTGMGRVRLKLGGRPPSLTWAMAISPNAIRQIMISSMVRAYFIGSSLYIGNPVMGTYHYRYNFTIGGARYKAGEYRVYVGPQVEDK
jgi:hypothetical protein